jgi:hypothetical protein
MARYAAGRLIALALASAGDAANAADAVPAPDRELLLFLAEFGDAEDGFIDPAAIDRTLDDELPSRHAPVRVARPGDAATRRDESTETTDPDVTPELDHAPPELH